MASRLTLSTGTLDLERGVLFALEGERSLTDMESKLLRYLADADRPVSQEELLVEVWGYAATVVSRTVRTTVGRLRSKIERDSADPEHLITEPGEGYRLVVLAGSEGSGPDLVGRGDELERLRQAFDAGARLVTVIGPPGVGCTCLVEAFVTAEPGAVLVDSQLAADRDALATGIASALGGIGSGDAWESLLRREPRGVVALDHVDGVLQDVRELGEAWSGVRLLVCAPAPLGLGREQVLELAPLSDVDTAVLFRRKWSAARLGAPEESDDATIQAIARKLDGLPVLVELAASWAGTLTLPDLLARLEDPGWLSAGELDSAIDAALEQLDATDRELLGQLTVFSSFEPATAERVFAGPGVLKALRRLRDRCWLQRDAQGRLSLSRVVRARLGDTSIPEDIRRGHAEACVAVAQALDVRGPGQAEGLDRLERERADLVAAHAWACGSDPELAVRILGLLATLIRLRGPHSLLAAVLERSPDAPEVDVLRSMLARQRGDPAATVAHAEAAVAAGGGASALLELAHARAFDGSQDEVAAAYQAALDAAAPTELALRAGALEGLGVSARARSDFAEALALLEQALDLARRWGDPSVTAEVCRALARVHRDAGRHDEVLAVLDLAPEPAPGPAVWTSLLRGTTLMELRRTDEALAVFDRCCDLARRLGMRRGEAWALARRLNIEVHLGDAEARRTLERARALNAGLDPQLALELQVRDVQLLLEAGATVEGRTALERLAQLPGANGDRERCYVAYHLGAGALFAGEPDVARERLVEAVALAQGIGMTELVEGSQALLALVDPDLIGSPAAAAWQTAIHAIARTRQGGFDPPAAALEQAELRYEVRMALRLL